jgi:DNA polymerase, archaea type
MYKFEQDKNGEWIGTIKAKGIETVRRDWCSKTGKMMKTILEKMLIEGDIIAAAKYAHEVILEVKNATLKDDEENLTELILTRKYSKGIMEYKNPPVHVKLIERMEKRGDEMPGIGDRVPFIIVTDYSKDFVDSAETLTYAQAHGFTLNTEYYLEKQILPPLERIFETFDISTEMLIKGKYVSKKKKTTQATLF